MAFDMEKEFAKLQMRMRLSIRLFPSCENDFWGTKWEKMIEYIDGNFKREEKEIAERKPRTEYEAESCLEDLRLAEGVRRVTCAMYIVALWSEMESILKHFQRVDKSSKKIEDRFDLIKIRYKAMGIDIEAFKSFKKVDAVRKLNNSFKHDSGCYRKTRKLKERTLDISIATSFEKKWKLKDREQIKYELIDLKDLTLACGKFNSQLVAEMKKKYLPKG